MPTKRILRSRTDRIIGGVAGGLATYLNVDPLYVRIGFVLLAFFQGLGVLAYMVLWLLVPMEGSTAIDGREQIQENVGEMQEALERLVDRIRRAIEGNRQGPLN